MQADLSDINLTPREVVERLDKYIVGQVSLQHQCYTFCILLFQQYYHLGIRRFAFTSLSYALKQQTVHQADV